MKKRVLYIASALVLGLGMTAQPAYANSVGTDLNLADLLDVDGASVTVGDKIFSNWTLVSSTGTPPVDSSQVYIDPLDDDPLNPGLRFETLEWFADSASNFSFFISFDVATADGSARIKDASLEFIEIEYTGGSAGSLESYLLGFDIDSDELFSVGLAYPGSAGTRFVAATFEPVSSMSVEWGILSAMTGDSAGGIRTLDIRISQVPEPTTLALFSLGLAGLGAVRRKKLVQRAAVASH
jgi:hypothetical protein